MADVSLPLREWVAGHLEENAESLVDRWLTSLGRRLTVSAIRLLPSNQLRDHFPSVLRSVANALRLPGAAATDEVRSYLRMLVELRREQGYPVVEVLREFEILTDLVLDDVADLIANAADDAPPAAELGRLFVTLHYAMSRIGTVAVETYQETYLGEKERLAEKLSGLASTLEHELRGPLQSAMTSADLLQQPEVARDEARRERYTETIRERLQRVSELIVDVRELAVAERSQAREPRRGIRDVIRDVFAEAGTLAERNGVTLEVTEPLPEIRVDPARVEVALMNLVNNAVKYADPEKPNRWVRITLREATTGQTPQWHLVVQDNGLGIPSAFQHRVFHHRVRAHPDVADGTGMGLAIVKELMEQRGGGVRFESEEGSGTTFLLELTPRIAEPHKTAPAGDDAAANAAPEG